MQHSQALYIRFRIAGVVIISTMLVIAGGVLSSGWLAKEPQIQIGVAHKGTNLPDGFFVYHQLASHGVNIKSITPEDGKLVIRLQNEEQRLTAQKILKQILSDAYTSA